jgi:hypothetical protein
MKICLLCLAASYALMKYVLFAQLPATHCTTVREQCLSKGIFHVT